MDVNIVWCVRDMRSNVRTVCMLYIVYAITPPPQGKNYLMH